MMKRILLALLATVWPAIALAQTVTINGLPAASALAGTEDIAVWQSSATKKSSPNAIQTYLEGIQNVFTKQQQFSPIATVTDASTIAWDVSVAQVGKVTITSTGRTLTPSNVVSGGTYVLYIIQGSGGSKTITTYTNIRWPGGTLPTLSTAAAAIDMISCASSDGTHLECVAQANFQ